jgi:hypothetical protein
MTTEKAYLMGLIVGGGIFRNNSMVINLPYRLWGKAEINPERAGKLANDILSRVRPLFELTYNMPVTFSTHPEWQIRSTTQLSNELIRDMNAFGITPNGKIMETGNLKKLKTLLNTLLFKRNFIAGLADSVGSLNPNHRRFDQNYQIISFEFAAKNNYELVFDICQILQEVNCFTDQLLWNHPNLHSSSNPYYKKWKKGYKVRVLIDSYVASCSFLFQAKAEAAHQNLSKQKTNHITMRCDEKGIDEHSVKTIHLDESSNWLPAKIRGYHFLHNKHICAVMGCPYAPVRELEQYVQRAEYWINPFPIYLRDTLSNVKMKISQNEVMSNRIYSTQHFSVRKLLQLYSEGQKLIWGDSQESGYPITQILQGIVWVIQREIGETATTRISGNYMDYLKKELKSGSINIRNIVIERPEKLTPLLIHNNNYATIIGPNNPRVYRNLITWHDNLRISVREIREDDLYE